MKFRVHIIVALFFMALTFFSCRKSDIVVDNTKRIVDDGSGIGNVTWTADQEYMLEGFVFVNPGQTLTIEPGTVIRAKTGQGENASALIISRGAKIIAEGTPENPIIFTVEGDDLEGSVPVESRGLWGGLIILGKAQLNSEFNESKIEGIPLSETRGIYGGSVNNDNSGILKYVSIRHGGTNIGENNEINGLTLGGVGSGTTIEYVEVVSNLDDGFEFFGGTVNCKYLAAAFCGDDAFDFDEGYRGKGQFWLAIQAPALGDNLAEHDGGTNPVYGEPYCIPEIYNATYIGNGQLQSSNLMVFSDDAGGKYYNSIFTNQIAGIEIEYIDGVNDSYTQFTNENLVFESNIFYQIDNNISSNILSAFNLSGDALATQQTALQNYFLTAQNEVVDPGISITETDYDVIPTGDVESNLASYPDEWYDAVTYKGAFDPTGSNWLEGWSLLSKSGKIR